MTIAAESLREGEQIIVKGKISYSRLAALVEGEALDKSIAQAKARGQHYPTNVPHTTVNLVDAQVLFANPASPTQEELYVAEKIYTVKSGDNQGKQGYGIDNKSTFLPTVLEPDTENPGGGYKQVVLERDLASGVEVLLVINTFSSNGYAKKGLGLQQVILQEPVRYYASGGVDTSALAARGIVINGPIQSVPGSKAPASAVAAASAAGAAEALPANTGTDANGFPAPTPGAQAPAPVAQQQFPINPAPVAAAPVAPVAPVAQAAPVETPEAQIARLQAQIAQQQAAAAGSGGASAFDGAAAAPAADAGPWAVTGQPGSFQG